MLYPLDSDPPKPWFRFRFRPKPVSFGIGRTQVETETETETTISKKFAKFGDFFENSEQDISSYFLFRLKTGLLIELEAILSLSEHMCVSKPYFGWV